MAMPQIENRGDKPPFFSVCIPQYNRTSFLLKALDAFRSQILQDFEICISDGGSTDGRHREIIEYLSASAMPHALVRHEQNLRYDPNLRSSIGLARGRYCLLFGNDDMPASADALNLLHRELSKHGFPEVVIPNYRQTGAGDIRRIPKSGILGKGPAVAAAHFRDFSFVSGILLLREPAQRHATDKWDGSEMYQMFLGCRLLAEGGQLLGLDEVLVLKDISIPGEAVDSYARKPVVQDCKIEERRLTLCEYGRVAFDAIAPYVEPGECELYLRRILKQVLLFSYPPWLVEYRRVQSWKYALGIGLGMRPRNFLGSLKVRWLTRIYLAGLYLLVTTGGLLMPQAVFHGLRSWLYTLAKGKT